jgi:hypothetical protein
MNEKLRDYVAEFMAIVGYLRGREGAILRDGCLLVKKNVLMKHFDRNRYDTATNKLAVWRALQWIDCDRERFTRRLKVNGEQITVVKIRLSVWEVLQQLTKTE